MFGFKPKDVELDTMGHSAQVVNSQLQDLMLTFPTLLIILNRKEEALYCIERCILICEKYKFLKTRAILYLMIGSMYLNDKDKSYEDCWEKAHQVLNMFINLNNKEGIAEANFLLGMIIYKKPKRAKKSDSLKIKKQSRSDLKFDNSFELLPKMSKTSSALRSFKQQKDEGNYLEVAKQYFIELKHQYGVARVSLAIAMKKVDCNLDNVEDVDIK